MLRGSVTRTDDALVGRTLGEFVVRERIGQGGFGAVYRAVQTGLEREAVLKVMSGALARAGTPRFLREAKLASRLDHPYAAHIYAFGAEEDGVLWIAMELVRGTPLDRLLQAQGTISLERFLPLLERICEVVHTAHEQGIIHRDIKPANVMVLSRAGRYLPKLLDFGIAKALGPKDEEEDTRATSPGNLGEAKTETGDPGLDGGSLTMQGAIMGSPFYMAPEQWMDAASAEARTDQYALGVLAYECLTGKPPFTGASINTIAVAHATAQLPPLRAHFPPALDAVLRRAVAKQVADRYPSVIELAAAFREASGLAVDVATLPQLDEQVRDEAVRNAPHPIAEGVAALEGARNAHQARDALFALLRTVIRYVGLLTLAGRTRVGSGRDVEPARVGELLRTLYRRSLSDVEWLELAAELSAGFRDKRDAYPIPELVDLLRGDAFAELLELHESAEGAKPLELLAAGVPQMSALLRAVEPLFAYTLAVPSGRLAERWMGVRRNQRTTVSPSGRLLPIGEVVLLDREHAPILSLAPLFQVAPPSQGAPLELFLFEGRGRRGAKLSALPASFEHHDETLWEWFRSQLTGTLDDTEGPTGDERPPYLGLSTFTASDASLFFGREAMVDGFVNRLLVNPFLAVVGRSGAGKSSFVQAGVIPALPAGWHAITMRPGPLPLAALSARLQHAGIAASELATPDALGEALRAHTAQHGPVLLVVDQLEELFTLCHDATERVAFATAIVRAARSADDPIRVVVTLRDDFLVRAEQLASFRARLGQGLQLLTVPAADDLLRTLVEPARRAGYELEEQLAQDMVKEVADEPSALPLLSFTASKLWELRDRHFKQLTRKAYQSLGGVGGALAQHAEASIEAMPADEQRLVREAFRHLVTSEGTRAVLTTAELRQLLGAGDGPPAVIEKLLAARLLTVTEGDDGTARIEIVHEALLVTWPRLVRWMREDAEGSRLRDQLRAAARQWAERQRSRGLLWRGDALADYQRWAQRHGGALTEVETAFAQASLAEAARGKWIRWVLIGIAFVGLSTAVILLVRSNARTQAKVAQLYEEQGRQQYLAGDSLRASVYLVAAKQAGMHGPAIDFLLGRTLSGLDRKQREIRGHEGPIMTLEYDRTGKRMLTASHDGTVRVWNAETGAAVHVLRGHAPLWLSAVFDPTGARIASGGDDGSVRVWDAATGQQLYARRDRQKSVVAMQFDHDSKRLLVAGRDGTATIHEAAHGEVLARVTASGALFDASFEPTEGAIWTLAADGVLAIWDAATGQRIAVLDEHAVPAAGIAFDPTGKLAVTGEAGALVVWDVAQRTRIATASLASEYRAIFRAVRPTFSRDGGVLAVNTVGGIELWTLAGSPHHTRNLAAPRGEFFDIAFAADGTRLATGGEDGVARVWDLSTGFVDASLATLDSVRVVRFSPHGQIVTASEDGIMTVWNPTGDEVTRRVVKPDRMRVVRFSPDGRELASSCADDTLDIWDAATGRRLRGRSVPDQLYLDWADSGKWLAGAGEDGNAYLWNATTLELERKFPGHHGEVVGIDMGPDDAHLATADQAGKVRIWDVASGQLLHTIAAHEKMPTMVAFDHSGRRLATAGRDNAVRIWNVATGQLVQAFTTDGWAMSVAFSPDDKRLLIADGRSAAIWNIAANQQLVVFDGHVRDIGVAQFGPNGLVVTGSFDATAKIWDGRSGRILASFARHQTWLRWAELDPTGNRLVTSSDDKSFVVWEIPRETRDTATLARIVREQIPFELHNETLVRRH